jgi:hypothetical protein
MTMRRCSKCQQLVADADWGTQRYCRQCWGRYNRASRARRREIDRLTDLYDQYYRDPVLGPKLKAEIEALTAKPNLPPPVL